MCRVALPQEGPHSSSDSAHPPDVTDQFQDIGITYFNYGPDGGWILRDNPVDLVQLATRHLESRWGRQAFLMMTKMGWSQGACSEGPDQFREVIRHSERFLKDYPRTESSESVRLELANAHATWWNLSRQKADMYVSPEKYKAGADGAKQRAIQLYQEVLVGHKSPFPEVESRLKALRENPKGSDTYDYLCADYED